MMNNCNYKARAGNSKDSRSSFGTFRFDPAVSKQPCCLSDLLFRKVGISKQYGCLLLTVLLDPVIGQSIYADILSCSPVNQLLLGHSILKGKKQMHAGILP